MGSMAKRRKGMKNGGINKEIIRCLLPDSLDDMRPQPIELVLSLAKSGKE